MEQKKVQRIIGIVVVIALVIIVMPLLFGKSDFPIKESANIKAPPFKDQQVPVQSETATTVASVATDTNKDSDINAAKISDDSKLPEPPALSGQITPPNSVNPTSDVSKNDLTASSSTDQPSPDASSPVAKNINDASSASPANPAATNPNAPASGSIIYEPATTTATITDVPATPAVTSQPEVKATEALPVEANNTSDTSENAAVKVQPVAVKTKHATIHHPLPAKHVKPKVASLKKSKSPQWVVQMGNFGVKKNAIHFANVLSAAGYKVITKEVKSASGNINTRVYIGPEINQAAAVKLSKDIHQKLNLPGFAVPYEPIKV